MLLGRESELDELERLVAGVRAGQSRALVLRGEAGVGKTALLAHLTAAAEGCRIARAAGVESEMELPFAGLHALCAPMLGRLAHLPEPQRDALNTAFGLSAGPPPDRFMVGLAVLSLLADSAEEQPLLCIVDDAQWLDRVSAQTLAFVARRLLAERVGLVFALRETGDAHVLEGLPELVIDGLAAHERRINERRTARGKFRDENVLVLWSEVVGARRRREVRRVRRTGDVDGTESIDGNVRQDLVRRAHSPAENRRRDQGCPCR